MNGRNCIKTWKGEDGKNICQNYVKKSKTGVTSFLRIGRISGTLRSYYNITQQITPDRRNGAATPNSAIRTSTPPRPFLSVSRASPLGYGYGCFHDPSVAAGEALPVTFTNWIFYPVHLSPWLLPSVFCQGTRSVRNGWQQPQRWN